LVSTIQIACKARLPWRAGSLAARFRTFVVSCTQQRCSRVFGHTSPSAFQNPRTPLAAASSGATVLYSKLMHADGWRYLSDYLVLTGGINMPNDFPPLTPREINLITENNRLRRGLLIAERQLILVMKTGKPPHKCAEAIQEIREALSGLKNAGLGPEDVFLDDEPDASA